ncbi:NarK/NasA family nitrate transporter [Mycobacterium heckeshornense]|uniref:MFS transporter n=1 Tax=Mycobacterium heckeshornense TaxID=110505 RepID=A0A2G8BGI9_9MYCO|nr:nitrate/nitrite transporter [Mycobacterium heckeshornense]MCV7032649.1 NarK/NasA family nitrate transporter [Mycobacterium heckeshornense]PIJ36870.1 NarK/NasA family nitrate transporter [Mycobacterium heckeshornense]BCO35370.1 MFS transporter [Mycobacterium heckeshornense]
MGRAHRIVYWNPEDVVAWEAGNKKIARRNLLCMMAADHVAFSIWVLWSVMVLFMPESVYGFSAADKLLLGATATLVGACLRIPYTLGIATFGGRNWTIFAALVLLIPTVGTIFLLAHPGLPLWTYMVCAALTGCGGANYAASLANINAFYPQRLKGSALGLGAGIGNLGVATVQVVGLVVLAVAGNRQPYWVCAVYLVLLAVVAIAATLFMDNLEHGIEVATLRSVVFERDTWILALLYVGTFGTFIGFSFAFGQVLQINFIASGQSLTQASLHAAEFAFIGPLLGSLSRIYGGRLADRFGGGRVTLAVFAGMVAATGVLAGISTHDDHTPGLTTSTTMTGYIVCLLLLFVLAGLGKGSVFKLIPAVIEVRSHTLEVSEADRRHWSRNMSGALIGFAAAAGAFGGVGVNLALRQSYQSTGTDTTAFWIFFGSYIAAAAVTWSMYVRRPVADSRSVASAGRAGSVSALVGTGFVGSSVPGRAEF